MLEAETVDAPNDGVAAMRLAWHSRYEVQWLFILIICGIILVRFDYDNLSRFTHVLMDQSEAQGVISAVECQVHDGLEYSFSVGNLHYSGHGYGGCTHEPGQTITVYFDASSPDINTAEAPKAALSSEIIVLSMTDVLFTSGIMLAIWYQLKRHRGAQ